MKINTLKYTGCFYKPRGLNDYVHFMIYANNYIGVSFRLLGYGFNVGVQIYDPLIEIRKAK